MIFWYPTGFSVLQPFCIIATRAIAAEILGRCGAVHIINVIYDFSTPYSLYTVMLSDSGSHPGGVDHPAVRTT